MMLMVMLTRINQQWMELNADRDFSVLDGEYCEDVKVIWTT